MWFQGAKSLHLHVAHHEKVTAHKIPIKTSVCSYETDKINFQKER